MFHRAPPDVISTLRGSHCPPAMANGYDSVLQALKLHRLQAKRPANAPHHHSSPAAFLYQSPTAQVEVQLHLLLGPAKEDCLCCTHRTALASTDHTSGPSTLGTDTASCNCTASCKVASCYGNFASCCTSPCKLPCLCSRSSCNDCHCRLQPATSCCLWSCRLCIGQSLHYLQGGGGRQ